MRAKEPIINRSEISEKLRNLGLMDTFLSPKVFVPSSQAHMSRLFLSTAAQIWVWLPDCYLVRQGTGGSRSCIEEETCHWFHR